MNKISAAETIENYYKNFFKNQFYLLFNFHFFKNNLRKGKKENSIILKRAIY